MQTLVVPKNRRPKFQLLIKIVDLNNVPYVTGRSYVKWHMPQSAAAEHSDRTQKCALKDHKVFFEYDKTIPVRLVVDKNSMLQDTWIHFEVIHEVQSAGKDERLLLGTVKMNIAEYVEASSHVGEEGVQRRYLLQDSKINCTIKIGISMKQIEGERNYSSPALKSAPVFVGIAGIMAGEEGDAEGSGNTPPVSTKAKEAGDELRELYRRTIAAEWTCQPGEPSADKCIEDIFAGGDGWGLAPGGKEAREKPKANEEGGSSLSEGEMRSLSRSKQRNWSSSFLRRQANKHEQQERHDRVGKGGEGPHESTGRPGDGKRSEDGDGNWTKPTHELNEFDVREDLRSWKA